MSNSNEPKIEITVEEIARDAQARVDEAAEEARADLAAVQTQIRELRRQLVSRAMTVRDRAVIELRAAADRIRDEAQGAEDEATISRAAQLAEGLERTATYLDGHSLQQVSTNVARSAQNNIWQALGVSFIFGLFIGLLIGVGERR